MRTSTRLLAGAALFALAACETGTTPAATDGQDATDSSTADAGDGSDGTTDATDGVDGRDGSDATDGTDTVDGTDAADATDATDAVDGTDGEDAPTFHEDIEPLLQRSCQYCHRPGAVAPFTLQSYAETAPLAPLIASTLEAREMPPWGVKDTESCTPRHGFEDDLSLTDAEIALFRKWADTGAKQGDVSKAPPVPEYPPVGLARVDVTLEAKEPYATEGKQDEFICFPLDPKFEADVWLQGVRVVPGNDVVAHHALVFTDPNRQSLGMANEQGWYPCFGSANVDDTQLVGVWAPGGRPNTLPDNAGIPISAGTLLVVQMHYHPVGEAQADRTRIELQLAEGVPEWTSLTALIGNFDAVDSATGDGLMAGESDPVGGVSFTIPAGKDGHVEKMRFTSPLVLGSQLNAEHRLYSVAPHMHYLGKSMTARVKRRDAATPFCELDAVGPILGCVQGKCADPEGGDVEACVATNCSDEYEAMPALCRDCVTAYAYLYEDVSQGFSTCLAAPVWTTTPQPAEECLFDAPEYDFQWQRLYVYDAGIDELPVVRPGDVLEFECRYDNTLGNAAVADALQYMGLDTPIDVELGETTLDEMCLLVVQTLFKSPTLE